jgi:hypothetical protein
MVPTIDFLGQPSLHHGSFALAAAKESNARVEECGPSPKGSLGGELTQRLSIAIEFHAPAASAFGSVRRDALALRPCRF